MKVFSLPARRCHTATARVAPPSKARRIGSWYGLGVKLWGSLIVGIIHRLHDQRPAARAGDFGGNEPRRELVEFGGVGLRPRLKMMRLLLVLLERGKSLLK